MTNSCKRVVFDIQIPGATITIWQPAFGGASGLETIVTSGLSSKTFMDGVPTYFKVSTSAESFTLKNGLLEAEQVTTGNYTGWYQLLATNQPTLDIYSSISLFIPTTP